MSQNKPFKDFRAGRVQASIWKTEIEKENGIQVRYSIRIQKQFKTEDGQYKDTDYFFPEELPDLALVTRKAYECIRLRERSIEDAS